MEQYPRAWEVVVDGKQASEGGSGGPAAIGELTVERRSAPVGIDRREPRLAWRLNGGGGGAFQSAYQVQVTDLDETGAAWSTPTWDSGRLEGVESTYIAYAGPPLVSRHRYAWRVRVWHPGQ